jgi:hypothetical protein
MKRPGRSARALGPPAGLAPRLLATWLEVAAAVPDVAIGQLGLEALVSQVARLRDAQARIETDGAVVVDAKGNATEHPAIGIERRAQAEIRTWLERYGAATGGGF